MTTELTVDTSGAATPEQAGLSRRTVVRTAANSAWAVPVVMVATAAPAFAASSNLSIAAFSAAYSVQGAAGVRPDLLTFSVQIANNGPQTTTALSFQLLIPKGVARFGAGNLYDTVHNVTGGAGWSSASVPIVGDSTYSHRVTFTRTGTQIASGGSLVLSDAVIKFSPALPEVEGSPYKPFVGSAYTVGGSATATNATGPASSTTDVAEAVSNLGPNTVLTINNFSAHRSGAALTVSAVGTGGAGAVMNTGRKTCGPITLRIVVPTVAGHRYYEGVPSATVTPPAGWTFGGRSTSTPWTYTFTVTAPPVAVASSAVAGNPAAEGNTPDFAATTIALSNTGWFLDSSATRGIAAIASAPFGAGSASDND